MHNEGIVHTDIQGRNILIDDSGRALVAGFGNAVVANGTASVYSYRSSYGDGSIRWTAPELLDPEEFDMESSRPTRRSDIYSFACLCVEVSAQYYPKPTA